MWSLCHVLSSSVPMKIWACQAPGLVPHRRWQKGHPVLQWRPHRPGFAHLCKLPGWGKMPRPASPPIGWFADNLPMRERESATTVDWDPPKNKFSKIFSSDGGAVLCKPVKRNISGLPCGHRTALSSLWCKICRETLRYLECEECKFWYPSAWNFLQNQSVIGAGDQAWPGSN